MAVARAAVARTEGLVFTKSISEEEREEGEEVGSGFKSLAECLRLRQSTKGTRFIGEDFLCM